MEFLVLAFAIALFSPVILTLIGLAALGPRKP